MEISVSRSITGNPKWQLDSYSINFTSRSILLLCVCTKASVGQTTKQKLAIKVVYRCPVSLIIIISRSSKL